MKQYCLKIQSKNEKSLKNFLRFFFKHLKTKFNLIEKSTVNQTNRKVVTFLKSPHVNKTAQTQFEMHIFARKILVRGPYLEKSLIFFKKVLSKLFQDISIHLEFLTHENTNNNKNLSLCNPNNIKLFKKNFLKRNFKRSKQKIVLKKPNYKKDSLLHLIKLLNTISVFGEILTISFLKKQ